MTKMKRFQIVVLTAAALCLGGCNRGQQQPAEETAAPGADAGGGGAQKGTAARARKSGGGVAREAAQPGLPAPQRPSAAQPRIYTVEAGSSIKVRTTTMLSTKTAKSGDSFVANLEEPLMAGDTTLAAKGAKVEGRIIESDPGGRVKGRAEIAVRLTKLHLDNGQTVDLATDAIAREARATKGQDAAKVGIGSGVGAAIGAIAGGGRGAAIGAAAGAGAGSGMVLATRGAAAEIPSETVLTFKLTGPVSVQR